MSWYLDVITKNYINFNGRARRREFWMFTLVHLIIIFLSLFLGPVAFILYMLLTIMPAVGVGIRRLHDTGRSGWWILAANVPILFVIYYYYMVLEGDQGANIYGDSPKESYMDRLMNDIDTSGHSRPSSLSRGSINLSDLDPEKLFGNEKYVQIIIVTLVLLSIILS